MAVKETLYYAYYSEHLMHLTIGTQCVRGQYVYIYELLVILWFYLLKTG